MMILTFNLAFQPFNLNFLNLQIKKLHDSSNKYVVFFNILISRCISIKKNSRTLNQNVNYWVLSVCNHL